MLVGRQGARQPVRCFAKVRTMVRGMYLYADRRRTTVRPSSAVRYYRY